MITWFQNLLVSYNHTSGHKSWWAVYTVGMLLIGCWVAAVLPWVDLFTGSMVGIGQFGGHVPNVTLVAYGYEIPGQVADYYYFAIFFGIAVAKIGLILVQVGGSFARGYKYWYTPGLGTLGCGWTTP
ncbi:MAG: hypothetical protein WC802_00315 [Patescibacteria group bacterium]|jgi:hypothetical protein